MTTDGLSEHANGSEILRPRTVEVRSGPIVIPTLVASVYRELRASILSGQFAPGQRLIETDLARQLGVSRGPVREALAKLEKDGITSNVPRRGKFVQELDQRLVNEVYSLRRILEQFAVELVILSMNSQVRRALETSLGQIERAATSGQVSSVADQDIAFHGYLYALSGHDLLRQAWQETISGKLQMLLAITERTHRPLLAAAANHRAIVEAILAGDTAQAQSLVAMHIDDARRRASEALARVQ